MRKVNGPLRALVTQPRGASIGLDLVQDVGGC